MRIAFLLFAISTAAFAQGEKPKLPGNLAIEALDKGHYLEMFDRLTAASGGDGTKPDDPYAFGMWQQLSAFVTNEDDRAVLQRAGRSDSADPEWVKRLTAAKPHDAIHEIVRRARRTNIVILNESHTNPRCRAFAWQVAKALRPLGYTILAAETFSPEAPAQLARDGFARRSSGFYVKDPVYAAFLRNALATGYRPIAYEITAAQEKPNGGIPVREQAEADNLMSAIFRDNPNAKVLIYVGHSHATEAPVPGGRDGKIEWMASRLKRMTGVDPLTIDQATLADPTPDYATALASVKDRPAIFFDGKQPLVLGQYAGAVDLQVVHPLRSYRDGRPAWLATLGGKPRPIPADLLPATGKRLVQAFAADAPEDAIPLDQVLVTAGSPPPPLLLPPGAVRFATQP